MNHHILTTEGGAGKMLTHAKESQIRHFGSHCRQGPAWNEDKNNGSNLKHISKLTLSALYAPLKHISASLSEKQPAAVPKQSFHLASLHRNQQELASLKLLLLCSGLKCRFSQPVNGLTGRVPARMDIFTQSWSWGMHLLRSITAGQAFSLQDPYLSHTALHAWSSIAYRDLLYLTFRAEVPNTLHG